MHDVTTLDLPDTTAPDGIDGDLEVGLADGARLRATTRGTGPRTVLLLDDRAPHESMTTEGAWHDDAWDRQVRTVRCDLRWAATGTAGLAPFDHQVAAADKVAVLDACGVAEADVVAVGAGVPQALALAALAPDRVRSLALLDPLVIGADRTWDDLAASFDEPMRFVRAHGFEGLEKELAADPLGAAAGPFGPQLARDPELVASLPQLGRERYVARVVAFRDGLFPDRPLVSVTAGQLADDPRPALVVPHPQRPGSADELLAVLPGAVRGLPQTPETPSTWHTVSQFLAATTA
jgi:pimeloyl-ACP methyl ester carboxylesterase